MTLWPLPAAHEPPGLSSESANQPDSDARRTRGVAGGRAGGRVGRQVGRQAGLCACGRQGQRRTAGVVIPEGAPPYCQAGRRSLWKRSRVLSCLWIFRDKCGLCMYIYMYFIYSAVLFTFSFGYNKVIFCFDHRLSYVLTLLPAPPPPPRIFLIGLFSITSYVFS